MMLGLTLDGLTGSLQQRYTSYNVIGTLDNNSARFEGALHTTNTGTVRAPRTGRRNRGSTRRGCRRGRGRRSGACGTDDGVHHGLSGQRSEQVRELLVAREAVDI